MKYLFLILVFILCGCAESRKTNRVVIVPKEGVAVTRQLMILGADSQRVKEAVVIKTKQSVEDLKKELGDDYHVYEDKVYNAYFLSGCEESPKAPSEPAPIPDQDPQVVPWGVSFLNSSEANKAVGVNDVVTCIVDSGVNYEHPDLKDAISGCKSFVDGESCFDGNGHGTHVAGTVSAVNNSFGVVGVNWGKLYIAKALSDAGSGYGSWIASAIYDCVDIGKASVINMSLGYQRQYGEDPLIAQALKYAKDKGVISVCAAGNDSEAVGWPAANPDCIAVSSMTKSQGLSSFSNYGPEVEYIAPGSNILSTYEDDYDSLSGTSMASPHVAGAFAFSVAIGKPLQSRSIGLSKNKEGKGVPDLMSTLQSQSLR